MPKKGGLILLDSIMGDTITPQIEMQGICKKLDLILLTLLISTCAYHVEANICPTGNVPHFSELATLDNITQLQLQKKAILIKTPGSHAFVILAFLPTMLASCMSVRSSSGRRLAGGEWEVGARSNQGRSSERNEEQCKRMSGKQSKAPLHVFKCHISSRKVCIPGKQSSGLKIQQVRLLRI